MNRRQTLGALLAALTPSSLMAANPSVSTLIGTGSRGYSDSEVNNPYGLVFGPDRALYFCDLDNQRIRRLDLKTHRTTAVAGNGQRTLPRSLARSMPDQDESEERRAGRQMWERTNLQPADGPREGRGPRPPAFGRSRLAPAAGPFSAIGGVPGDAAWPSAPGGVHGLRHPKRQCQISPPVPTTTMARALAGDRFGGGLTLSARQVEVNRFGVHQPIAQAPDRQEARS